MSGVERRPLRRRHMHGAAVVRALASAGGPISVPVVAKRSGVPVSAAHRLLQHFERKGMTAYQGSDSWALTDEGAGYARRLLVKAMAEAVP